MLIFTRLLSRYGTVTLAGYGIGARLEFMLVPIAASIGMASVPIVGMNVGAGNIERARKVAWTAGLLAGVRRRLGRHRARDRARPLGGEFHQRSARARIRHGSISIWPVRPSASSALR